MVVNGQRTVWGQQLDALTLAPTSARNYEMPALDSSESAMIVHFLMHVPHPDSNVVAAVHAACAWFKQTEMDGWKVTYESAGTNGAASRKWVKAPGGGPIWARFYQIGTNKPIFGDRDRTIHDDVNELSAERRKNYACSVTCPIWSSPITANGRPIIRNPGRKARKQTWSNAPRKRLSPRPDCW